MDTPSALTPTEVIEGVRAAQHLEQAAAVQQLELALAWARLHPCPTGETPAHWGEVDLHGEATVLLAGPGAPLVAEFAPADLGAALSITLDAARLLLGDARLVHKARLFSTPIAPSPRRSRSSPDVECGCVTAPPPPPPTSR